MNYPFKEQQEPRLSGQLLVRMSCNIVLVCVPAVVGGNPRIPANDTALRSGNGRLRFGRLGRFGRGGRPDGKDIKPEDTKSKSFSHMNI